MSSEQHITKSRELGLDTVGFLMMSHMVGPEKLIEQAKLMEGYGANCIYVTDSAGYMLPEDVTLRLGAVRDALQPETELGFHGPPQPLPRGDQLSGGGGSRRQPH